MSPRPPTTTHHQPTHQAMTTANDLALADIAEAAMLTDMITGHYRPQDWKDGCTIGFAGDSIDLDVVAYDAAKNIGIAESKLGTFYVFTVGREVSAPASRSTWEAAELRIHIHAGDTIAHDGVIYAAKGEQDRRRAYARTWAVEAR